MKLAANNLSLPSDALTHLDPPYAWLDFVSDESKLKPDHAGKLAAGHLLRLDMGSDLNLKCTVASNPLNQNTILQIDWLKDGRKIQASSNSSAALNQSRLQRLSIEKTNHLHMPQSQLQPDAGPTAAKLLVSNSKLIGISSLSIKSLGKSDSGQYTCQFKLIPAPGGGQQTQGQQQFASAATTGQSQPIRITSGQANNSLKVTVIEGKFLHAKLQRRMASARLSALTEIEFGWR